MEQSVTIDIAAPVERVWEVLSDLETWSEWTETVDDALRLDDGPLRVGSRARLEQPKLPPTEYEVSEMEPGRSFTLVARGPGVRTTARHVLEVVPTGGTRATLSVEQAGPVGAVTGRLFRGLTDRYLKDSAEGLKARSEGSR